MEIITTRGEQKAGVMIHTQGFQNLNERLQGINQASLDRIVRNMAANLPPTRKELIQQFIDGINRTAQWKVHFPQIASQLKSKGYTTLTQLLKECNEANNFGAYFWWKVKKDRAACGQRA